VAIVALMTTATVTDDIIREVARAALANPTTVVRRLVQLPVRGRERAERIDRELAARGLLPREAPGA
jgi:hypothetical protein